MSPSGISMSVRLFSERLQVIDIPVRCPIAAKTYSTKEVHKYKQGRSPLARPKETNNQKDSDDLQNPTSYKTPKYHPFLFSCRETNAMTRPKTKEDYPIPPHVPRILLASWMSFCMIVTRLACMAHRFVSSKRWTRYASAASWRA